MNLGRADSIEIHGTEDGFEMKISTDRVVAYVNIHACALQLMRQVDEQIREWWAEGEQVRAEFNSRQTAIFACDPDESGGYDTSDPKHPAYHSTHADLWDLRDKGA